MTYHEFCERLVSLKVEANTFSLIDADHPLNIYVGYNDQLFPTFMIVGNQNVDAKNIKETRSIAVSDTIRKDGSKALTFSCKDSANRDIFGRLCFDMLEAARKASPTEKYACLIQRYLAWYKMLEGVRPELLTIVQQKGLCGELLFLTREIPKIGTRKAVDSWMGPHKADQDFIMEDTWVEIKSVKLSADSVSISSLDQLSLNTPGTLAIYKIESTNNLDPQRFSLFSLADDLLKRMQDEPDIQIAFVNKLLLAGCDFSENTYKNTFFLLKEESFYEVCSDFPRLTHQDVPTAVTSANYAIDLCAIAAYKKECL